jgi:hypothetical protein
VRGEKNETKCSVASVKLDVIGNDLCDFNNKRRCLRKNVINAQFVMLQPFKKAQQTSARSVINRELVIWQ